jgi:transposase
MLTVDDYAKIRLAHRDGMPIRELASTFHHSRYKIRQILKEALPRPYTRSKPPPAPVLGSFHAAIDAILAADEDAPPKQRHTAMQVFRRLRDDHGFSGGYDAVRRYIGKRRRDHRETFIPLAHDPGQRLEADFGHIHVDFPDGRRLVPVLIAAWAYSHYGFALALPTERTEAILTGMIEAFAFFGCVPREVWWDNPTTVVAQIFTGRDRRPNRYYAALASHYTFEPFFSCRSGATRSHMLRHVFACCNSKGPRPFLWLLTWMRSTSTYFSAVSKKASAPCKVTTRQSGSASAAIMPVPRRCRRIRSMLASSRRPRWTSTRPCVSTTTVTAYLVRAPTRA